MPTHLSTTLLVWLGAAAAAAGADKQITAADCRFTADPSSFLERGAHIRREVLNRAARLNRLAPHAATPVPADQIPQRNFVDQEIFGRLKKAGLPSAPLSSDEEFLRRVTLDLTGRIPAAADVRAFVADSRAGKRDAAIDRLLQSPEYTDKWTMWMGDLLGNTSKLVNAATNRNAQGRNAFHAYLKDAVASDKSLRAVAGETITGTGNNYDAASGAANFALGASTAMGPLQDTYDTMLVRTASMYLGLGQYDCVLCHNGRGHLTGISLWGAGQTRAQAQSMAAFFSRMQFAPAAGGSVTVTDAQGGGYDLNTDSGNRPPRTPLGDAATLTPAYRDSGAAPKDGNWRAAFAANLVRDPMFARNLANRLWKQMFGLALVDPVDSLDPARLDPANPPDGWELQPSHPELLEKLAGELAANDFALRPFLRTLVQSSAYQLSSRFDGDFAEGTVPLFSRHYARRLEGEEVHDAIATVTGIPGSYVIQGWPDRVAWAMQLPEPVEPAGDAGAARFMNTFLRGDRDTQDRSQAGSIQQQLYLMNDSFVIGRVKAAQSPALKAIAQMASDDAAVEEMYLAFLSRRPSEAEKALGASSLGRAGASGRNQTIEDLAWMLINKVEFLYSY